MEGNNSGNKVLKKYAQEVQCEKLPPPRFDHTVNLISKINIVIFMEQLVHQIIKQVIL